MSRQRKQDASLEWPRRSIGGRENNKSSRVYSAPVGGADREPKLDFPVVLTPWEAFQEHLRLIDDNSAMYTFRDSTTDREKDKDAKKIHADADDNRTVEQKATDMAQQLSVAIKVKNSDVFEKTMHEFQLRRQQHLERLAVIQRERERRARELEEEGHRREVSDVLKDEHELLTTTDWSDGEDPENTDKKTSNLRQAASRGWAMIRRHIEEKAVERKQKSSAMNWTFLRQTISHMTDLEKGRQSLYERYLVNPDSWKDGFTNFPNELFDKEHVRERRMYGSQPNIKRANKNRYKKTKSLRSVSSIKTH
ncbi:hypothetical protein LSH36_86g02051 [Paralvinella palmiformis]|uniref:Uncharacterized protein n=1 Tax=Paralvinella palmiformis TaxID=53620 RepID=A0AAD9NAN0_9ANNE|nr:hypothetical protein LSH36_86g02051 [Paralvinella palmiformis]